MRDRVTFWISAMLAAIVGVVGLAAAVRILVTIPYPDNKGAEWVAAIGTVGTLIGTIFLATAETRRRKSEDLVRARLYGAGMALRFAHAGVVVDQVVVMLLDSIAEDPGMELYRMAIKKMQGIDLWEVEDVSPLIPLPNGTAAKLAAAAEQIRTSIRSMGPAATIDHEHAAHFRADLAERLYHLLKGTGRFLHDACTVCDDGTAAMRLLRE